MKKNYILRTLLLVVALCGVTTSWGQTYKKITTLDELESGKSYVITGTDNGASMAMNTSNDGKFFKHTAVTVENNTIVTSDATIVWTITKEADGNYSIKNGNVYVACNKDANNAQIENAYATTAAWTISVAEEIFSFNSVNYAARYLQWNSNTNQERFACYKGTMKNLNLYKLEESTAASADVKFEDGTNKLKFYSEGATFSSKATTASTATIAYSSSDEAVATIDSEGLVTLKGVGETTIKAEVEANDTYQAGVAVYTLTVKALGETLPYTNDFKSGLGNWINYTVVGTTEWGSSNYGAQINAYQKGATEAYFVSPAFDTENVVLSFGTQLAYSEMPLQLYYSTDFNPQTMSAPSEATWTEITDQATWATSSETTESGEITLNNLTAPVRFAFKYTSTDTDAGRWTITDLKVEEGIPAVTGYTVTVANAENGEVTVLSSDPVLTINEGDVENNVPAGTQLIIMAKPATDYEVATALGNETPLTLSANGAYYEATVTEDLTITATFKNKNAGGSDVTLPTPVYETNFVRYNDPTQIPEPQAGEILNASAVTVALDYTLEALDGHQALVGATSSASSSLYVALQASSLKGLTYNYAAAAFYPSYLDGITYTQTGEHVKVAFVISETETKLYLNGELIGTQAGNLTFKKFLSGSGELYVGGVKGSTDFKFKFDGDIHSARFYTQELTEEQIKALANDEGVTPPAPTTYTVTIPQNDNATIVVTDAEGNVITNGAEVAEGTVLTIEATANEGYEVEEIWVNAEPIEGNTVTVNGNITISAYVINLYRVNVTVVGEGTVVIKDRDSETTYESGAYIPSDVFVNLAITPAEGYELTGFTSGTNDYLAYVEEGIFEIGTLTFKDWDFTVTFTEVSHGPEYCTYSGTNQHTGRSFNSLTVTGGKEDFSISKYVGNGGDIYQDCTHHVLIADAGAALNFSTSWNGEWMHGYLYIDYNNDGEFDAAINDDGTPAEGSEIVSYTFYSPTDAASGKNSAGEDVANNSKLDYFPGFTLPANLATGEYRVRFKIDWNELDPCGIHADGKNSLNTNGGLILDFTLAVEGGNVEPGDGYEGKGVFTKVTSATEITTGEYVFVANGFAMSNEVSSNKMLGVTITDKLSTDGLTVTDPEVAHVWSITEDNGIYTIKNGENILGYNSGTNFTFNTTANETEAKDQWTLNAGYDTPLFQSVAATDRFILLKNGTTTSPETRFGPYSQTNINGNGYANPVLYKWNKGTDAIEEVEQVESLKVINGKGQLTILAGETTDVVVYSITGATVVNTTVEAGNTTFALPAGIYIVNGVKAIVF